MFALLRHCSRLGCLSGLFSTLTAVQKSCLMTSATLDRIGALSPRMPRSFEKIWRMPTHQPNKKTGVPDYERGKLVWPEVRPGQAALDDANKVLPEIEEEDVREKESENKASTSSAKANATNALASAIAKATNALAINAAIGIMKRVNDFEQCNKIVTGFSAEEKDIITKYLSKGLAEFEIQVHLKEGPKRATLRLLRESIQLVVEDIKLIKGSYRFPLEIKFGKGSQFILGDEYTCDTEGNVILRDIIVATVNAFLAKATFYSDEPEPEWIKPEEGWLKFNMYGMLNQSTQVACIGGLIRDDSGNWITGFWGKVMEEDEINLRLEALKIGLDAAQQIKGERGIIIETDEELIVDYLLLKDVPEDDDECCHRLIVECRKLLKELGESNYKLWVIDRSENRTAEVLTGLGHKLVHMGVKKSNVAPTELKHYLRRESTRIPSYLLMAGITDLAGITALAA